MFHFFMGYNVLQYGIKRITSNKLSNRDEAKTGETCPNYKHFTAFCYIVCYVLGIFLILSIYKLFLFSSVIRLLFGKTKSIS